MLADMLKGIEKKQKELSPIQQRVKDHSIKFSKLNKAEELKLAQDIAGLGIPRLDDEYIALIVDLLPKNINELRMIFAGSKVNLAPESFDKIMDVLKKYAK